MKYPYSKHEAGIILATLFSIWGIGAHFEGYFLLSKVLLITGLPALSVLIYLRYFKKN